MGLPCIFYFSCVYHTNGASTYLSFFDMMLDWFLKLYLDMILDWFLIFNVDVMLDRFLISDVGVSLIYFWSWMLTGCWIHFWCQFDFGFIFCVGCWHDFDLIFDVKCLWEVRLIIDAWFWCDFGLVSEEVVTLLCSNTVCRKFDILKDFLKSDVRQKIRLTAMTSKILEAS